MIAKPPLTARPGWFSDENKWKTTPAASASVAARNFLDDAATPPCGRARRGRRGITLDSSRRDIVDGPRSASATARSLKKIDRRYSSVRVVRLIRGQKTCQKNKKLRLCVFVSLQFAL